MTSSSNSLRNNSENVPQPQARFGLAIMRLTIGAMFLWVFFENRGKGLYTPSGYAGLINYYIQHDHAPTTWRAVMAAAASHAAMAAPMQAITEIEKVGALVAAVVCIVDRLEGAREAIASRYEYRPIFTIRDFGIPSC